LRIVAVITLLLAFLSLNVASLERHDPARSAQETLDCKGEPDEKAKSEYVVIRSESNAPASLDAHSLQVELSLASSDYIDGVFRPPKTLTA
jgi:hypothetical protein